MLEFTVGYSHRGMRLDRFISDNIPDCSRSFLQELIKSGNLRIDGTVVTLPRFAVKEGMSVTVEIPDVSAETAPAADDSFDYEIIFEDDAMLVINKPAGVSVHPGAGNPDGTVVNALLGRYPGFADLFPGVDMRPGIVHRLDKDTTGCLVIAKTPQAQFKLGEAFANRQTSKKYCALVRGVPASRSGKIENLIGRHPVNRQKMAVVERNGKIAISQYKVIKPGFIGKEKITLVEVDIFTGRTHQIRVHMAHIGYPVLGDQLYGGSRTEISGVNRQMLHARTITLPHPSTGKPMTFTAKFPVDFAAITDNLQELPS